MRHFRLVPCGHLPVRLHRILPVHTAADNAGIRPGTGGDCSTSMVPGAAEAHLSTRIAGTPMPSSYERVEFDKPSVQPGTFYRVDRAAGSADARSGVDTVHEVDILSSLRGNF
jgi:hypothetical protein